MHTYNLIIVGIWVISLVYFAISAVGTKKHTDRNPMRSRPGIPLGLMVIVFLVFRLRSVQTLFQRLSPPHIGPEIGITGVALVAAGVGLAIWARAYLGKNWGLPMTLQQQPELVTSGPYRFVRHPIYSGWILAMTGSALASGAFWMCVQFVFCAYFVFSAFAEEAILSKEFPTEYPKYKKRSKMLIPFIL
jgi:protein-S-isoprenylcysteine O-methyltransferase Ste14